MPAKSFCAWKAKDLFDGIFIDGNKAAYGDYLAWAEKMCARVDLFWPTMFS